MAAGVRSCRFQDDGHDSDAVKKCQGAPTTKISPPHKIKCTERSCAEDERLVARRSLLERSVPLARRRRPQSLPQRSIGRCELRRPFPSFGAIGPAWIHASIDRKALSARRDRQVRMCLCGTLSSLFKAGCWGGSASAGEESRRAHRWGHGPARLLAGRSLISSIDGRGCVGGASSFCLLA